MPSKRLIPAAREDDVLYTYWNLLLALESKCEVHVLDKPLVTAAYNVLNDIGFSKARPRWEETPMFKEARRLLNDNPSNP